MSETIVFNFKDLRVQLGDFCFQVDEIFFEASSKKDFKDQKEREAFRWKYLGFYLGHYPEYAWLAVSQGQVTGYVVGMPFTQDPSVYRIQPHLKSFESSFTEFPAHLHINCHSQSRGQGVGRILVEKLLREFKAQGVSGVHIMTGTQALNRSFYERLGFDQEVVQGDILLLGKKLFI